MAGIKQFLKVLFHIAPLEFIVALLRLLLLPILALVAVVLHLIECFLHLWPKTTLFEEEKEDACPPLPEPI
ncbi:MAG TPA: hypothetical protein VFE11_05715, partial [Dongiaceae bacterium]|nr:hypothetical protein [Dongiaceae bacterium]